ncbi:MAG: hypothetical protein RL323_432, partial [Pseudomonadota bacterium]
LLLAYHHPSQPLQLDPNRYEMLTLGQEVLLPYVRPDLQGQATHRLPGAAAHPVPFLAYAPGAYLGRVVEWAIKQFSSPVHLQAMYETDMSESLKAMAIEGHGVAFLPTSSVRQALRDGRLVDASPPGIFFGATLEIRLYREKPQPGKGKTMAHSLWDLLASNLLKPDT